MPNRILASPSVAWAATRMVDYDAGKRRERPEPFNGKIMGRSVVDGVVEVPEEATYTMATGTATPHRLPEWQVWVLDFHFTDITEARGGLPPVVPLPWKPFAAQERERMAQMWAIQHGTQPWVQPAVPPAEPSEAELEVMTAPSTK